MSRSSTRAARWATCAAAIAIAMPAGAAKWGHYGADAGGTRHTPARQITPANVARLRPAWTFRTGELGAGLARADKLTFEATPILVGRTLYFNTATAIVFAIDAVTGEQRWRFDAGLDRSRWYSEMAARGVSHWRDAAPGPGPCRDRIIVGTLDARLIALDAITGGRCAGFGVNGEVDLSRGVRLTAPDQYHVTSPPAVVGDVVVTGSAIGDNRGTSLELGVVRGYDARSGALLWRWDPIPRTAWLPTQASDPDFGEIDAQAARWTGAANAWSVLSADPERGLVFIPTGSASPDFYGGERPGDNRWANSVVALEAATGRLVWGRQLVRHDLWDYDVASQPVLGELVRDGARVPAVIQVTKSGQMFVFERTTGQPLFPVVDRPVPQGAVPGEAPAPTQPFSSLPSLVPNGPVTPQHAWGLTFWDRNRCAERIAALRSEGIFTPPSLEGTILRPGYAGGANWGSAAFDPDRQLAVVNVMDVPMVVTLLPRDRLAAMRASGAFEDSEFAHQQGTPYAMRREPLMSPLGIPCIAPPWGYLVAMDLAAGRIAWKVPLGTTRDLAPFPFWWFKGVPNIGGPIVTASGLVFIGAAADDYLRAFDIATGRELWKGRLPAGGQATPMSYEIDGRQYVVIAAGGHGGLDTTRGDALVAFALRDE